MSGDSRKYCFDTNCFIEPWNSFYPAKSHLSYWDDFILPRIIGGEIMVLEEVYREIQKKDDALYAWFRNSVDTNGLLIPTDPDLVSRVGELLGKYPRLSDTRRGRSIADPFLIAYAKAKGLFIVTQEKLTHNPEKPNIPDVCRAEQVPYIDLFQYISETNVSFRVMGS